MLAAIKHFFIILLFATAFISCSRYVTETGKASYYGDDFDGKPTANGETFHKNNLTAAHKTLPFGTIVKVKNESNGKTVSVRINDRGPFVKGRIIDLSEAAAKKIDMLDAGVVTVLLKYKKKKH